MIRDDVTGGWMVKRVWREDVVLASEEKKTSGCVKILTM